MTDDEQAAEPAELAERPEESMEQIEAERAERLDPDNRPDDVEIDNTGRDFDAEKGMFTDSDGYESAPTKYPGAGDQGA